MARFRQFFTDAASLGGSSPFGIYKQSFTGTLGTGGGFTNDSANSYAGVILGTVALGTITNDLEVMGWVQAILTKITVYGGHTPPYNMGIMVRDTTVKPTASGGEFAKQLAAGNGNALLLQTVSSAGYLPPGTYANNNNVVNSAAGLGTATMSINTNFKSSSVNLKDSYNNVVANGDTLVADIGIASPQSTGGIGKMPPGGGDTGTFSITAWFSALFS